LAPIEEGNGPIILGDDEGGRVTSDDPTEDAIAVHRRSLLQRPPRAAPIGRSARPTPTPPGDDLIDEH
jgi:hypothetical protein